MKRFSRRSITTAAASLALAGAFWAGYAMAADARLDQADANVEKAIALLEASQNEGVKPPFGGHRLKAVIHLKAARKEIAKAKAYADNPKPPKGKGKGKHHDKDKDDDKK
ncbi:MAG: hypothetical protein R3B13_39980 [Polyangiaceae bacterium]